MKNAINLFGTRSVLCAQSFQLCTPNHWFGAIALIAVIGLSMTGCPDPASSGGDSGGGGEEIFSENGFNYKVNDGYATVTITSYNGTEVDVSIPAKLNNKPVTSIGYGAFYQCASLTSVTIPNSVTSIEHAAFSECTSLTSVTIPNSVTSIGGSVFLGCHSLASVTIGNGVTSIGDIAFYQCASLTSVTIPASVISIGVYAFSQCTSLTSVMFATGSNIANTNFGDNAFPEGSSGYGGNTLKTAYSTGKAGTYTKAAGGSSWTKQS